MVIGEYRHTKSNGKLLSSRRQLSNYWSGNVSKLVKSSWPGNVILLVKLSWSDQMYLRHVLPTAGRIHPLKMSSGLPWELVTGHSQPTHNTVPDNLSHSYYCTGCGVSGKEDISIYSYIRICSTFIFHIFRTINLDSSTSRITKHFNGEAFQIKKWQ